MSSRIPNTKPRDGQCIVAEKGTHAPEQQESVSDKSKLLQLYKHLKDSEVARLTGTMSSQDLSTVCSQTELHLPFNTLTSLFRCS
mmetsp:Transcript_962/g.1510  ORF Transcript_962/g.1510 Transcript_962/m.1510 type:complete len:85 (+) Transcript_962:534-788(+)